MSDTETVMEHHLKAVGSGNLDEIMLDYAEDSAIHTQSASYYGLAQIRQSFVDFLATAPASFNTNFKMSRRVIDGDIGYIVWEARPEYLLGTDTYLIRNGKIRSQMFTSYLQP